MESLDKTLRELGAAEANLEKLERIWGEIEEKIPEGLVFGESDADYDSRCLAFRRVLRVLPAIDGFRIEDALHDLDTIAQMRFDVLELDDFESKVAVETEIARQGRLLSEYRIHLGSRRRQLARVIVPSLLRQFEERLEALTPHEDAEAGDGAVPSWSLPPEVRSEQWEDMRDLVAQIDAVLGASLSRPPRWDDLRRHLHFALLCDYRDIQSRDWPSVRRGLGELLQQEDEPVPSEVEDLGTLVTDTTVGTVVTALNWNTLSGHEFERLIYSLFVDADGYDNPEWLMHTNAPDRGRDLSVYRAYADTLGGTIRQRVLVQCRNWPERSVAPSDVATLREQMKLWEPPRVDVVIIATSGRFSADAVALIEKHNQDDHALGFEMWPAPHLERLLARRPALVADFGLR